MAIWAIADLHLSFGVPNKEMHVFGEEWAGHPEKLKKNWVSYVSPDDLVLIAGDISWAMHLEDVIPDLEWIDHLPGTKVIIRGNHDYWWSSLSKVQRVLPPTIHAIQNNTFEWKGVSIAGARLWDTSEYSFGKYIDYQENSRAKVLTAFESDMQEAERLFQRELGRLEMSLKELKQTHSIRIAMTHYPPIGATLEDSSASKLLEKYGINICVFGHLHRLKRQERMFGEKKGIKYYLTACDYLDFKPLRII
jgi:predicted phosphohydrolase